ncbi:hypothetical protein [Escherichia coli]
MRNRWFSVMAGPVRASFIISPPDTYPGYPFRPRPVAAQCG